MSIPIGSIGSSPAIVAPASGGAQPAGIAPTPFGDTLSRLVNAVDSTSQQANAAVEQMLGGQGDVHDAMIAMQKAEMTLQLTVQVRNKLVQAYQDIMRMPV